MGALVVNDEATRRIEMDFDKVGRLVADAEGRFDPQTEFHAVDMFQGKNGWRHVSTPLRVKACRLACRIIAGPGSAFYFRGINVEAQLKKYRTPYPPHQLAFAHVISDVDKAVGVRSPKGQVAIIMADEHHAASDSRRNLRDFKLAAVPGYNQRKVRNIGDTVFFGPSHASRLLQAADLATYFMNRHHTIAETDPRTAKAMDSIVADIRRIMRHEYIWQC